MSHADWVCLAVCSIVLSLILVGAYNTPCDRNVFCIYGSIQR